MNKHTIIIILLLISFTYSESKSSSQFGVKMGMVSSKYEYEIKFNDQIQSVLYNHTRNGPTMGIYFRFLNYYFINLESEFNYLQRGGQETFQVTTVEEPQGAGERIFDVQFDYMQIQLNLRPYFTKKMLDMYGIIGISVNYLLGVKNSYITMENLKEFTVSYSIGAGLEFNVFPSNSFLIEFTMNSDISNIYRDLDREFMFKTYTVRLGLGF